MVAQRRLGSGSELRLPPASGSTFSKPMIITLWGATLAATFTIFSLTCWHPGGHALCIVPVVNLLAAYITLTPATYEGSWFFQPLDIGSAIRPLSSRISTVLAVTLGLEMVVFGFPGSSALSVLVLGLAKALFWYFVIHTVCINTLKL